MLFEAPDNIALNVVSRTRVVDNRNTLTQKCQEAILLFVESDEIEFFS